jgi:YjbE family integral membrane protein
VHLDVLLGSASILLIDLVLAGDNAVVIGMAARTLAPRQRRAAIMSGALLAVVFRVLATMVVAQLLAIPFLSAVGGLLVAWIAVRLVVEDESADAAHEVDGFWRAVRVIVVADLIMSADNILAVGGASGGRWELILFGLVLSIPLVMFCSSGIAALLDRYPRLAELGAAVLGWTAGQMILHDLLRHGSTGHGLIPEAALGAWLPVLTWGLRLGLAVGVVALARYLVRAKERRAGGAAPEEAAAVPPALQPEGETAA